MSNQFFKPVWGFPAAGLGTAVVFTMIPGHVGSLDQWPAGGPFGAFTWGAFVVSLGLALTLIFLALELGRRSWIGAERSVRLGRVLAASGLFAMMAVLAFAAAARIDFLETHPGFSFVLACGVLAILAPLTDSLNAPAEDLEADDNSTPTRARIYEIVQSGYKPILGFVLVFGGFWLLVAIGTHMKWLGPAFGDVITFDRPVVIYWSESAYFDDAANRLNDPKSDASQTRFRFLPEGSKVEIKRWVNGGYEVAVQHDPKGISNGESGYIRARDIER